MAAKASQTPKRIALALQGGGALGAYSWGVIDRLLEDARIEIVAVSGASAGAMNAVVLTEGLEEGGPEGARTALRRFWEGVARMGTNPLASPALDAFMAAWAPTGLFAAASPLGLWFDFLTRVLSPYEINPFNINPLREILQETVDFERVKRCESIDLFIAATNIETGKVRVFTNAEIGVEHVLASAALPQLFQAVTIEGCPYWDGGYMGNPPLFPLFESEARDIFIVQINPIERPGVPRAARDIAERINEITFNASLLRELRAIEFVARLLDEGRLDAVRYRRMLIHTVSDDAALAPLGAGAGLHVSAAFFEELFQIGRLACDRWLDAHYHALGKRSTVDLRRMFEGETGPIAAPPPGARRRKRPD